MAINIGKLWRDPSFLSLDNNTRLLYLYLISSPDVDTLGLINIDLSTLKHFTKLEEGSLIRGFGNLLNKIVFYRSESLDTTYYFIKGHFETLPRSASVSNRAKKDLSKLPDDIIQDLKEDGYLPDIEQHSEFIPPTSKEVIEYSISRGYLVDGDNFINFYESTRKRLGKKSGWWDSRGKEVRDWKAKLRKVWFKEQNKIEVPKNAPKGFEYFYVMFEGKPQIPEKWLNDKPFSSNIALGSKLQYEYRLQKDS